jgi:hypothetical protein
MTWITDKKGKHHDVDKLITEEIQNIKNSDPVKYKELKAYWKANSDMSAAADFVIEKLNLKDVDGNDYSIARQDK